MQEQNFEKQVRDKMDELSFVPSAPVWEKVEEQIKKKKDKRRIIFWLLPLLLASGLGWWLIVDHQITALKEQKKTVIQNSKELSNKTETGVNATRPESSSPHLSVENSRETIQPNVEKLTFMATQKYIKGSKGKQPVKSSGESALTNKQESILSEQPKTGKTGVLRVKYPSFHTIFYGFNADSLNIKELIANLSVQIPQFNPEQSASAKRNKKWQLAIAAQFGISGLTEGFVKLGKPAADMLYSASTISVGNGFGNTAITPPSPPKSNTGFAIGLDVKRKINSSITVLSGLRYAYYSNSLQVGSKVNRDTTFSRYDRSILGTKSYYLNDANKHSYTNQYHFIQIPVNIEYKPMKKLPFYVQGGIKIEQMLWSNALFYNQNSGVYVKDKAMLSRTGVQLFSGLNYHFRGQRAFSFSVGPQIQYGLTNLSKNKSNNQHLYFVGISTQFFLKNK